MCTAHVEFGCRLHQIAVSILCSDASRTRYGPRIETSSAKLLGDSEPTLHPRQASDYGSVIIRILQSWVSKDVSIAMGFRTVTRVCNGRCVHILMFGKPPVFVVRASSTQYFCHSTVFSIEGLQYSGYSTVPSTIQYPVQAN